MTPPRLGARASWAAVLLAVGLLLPLVVWLSTGWSAVRAAQAGVDAAARDARRDGARALGSVVAARLIALRDAESRRPYFHYQNLFHDPRAVDNGASIVPSPLAAAPADPSVWSYFQIDATGRLTVPTVNDALPELNVQTPDDGRRALAELRPVAASLRALAMPKSAVVPPAPIPTPTPTPTPLVATNDGQLQQQQVLPGNAYQQNVAANDLYAQLKNSTAKAPVAPAAAVGEVTITIEPLRFALVRLASGETRLVAVRTVSTPAGTLTQGQVFSLDAALAAVDPSHRARVELVPEATPGPDDEVPLSLSSGAVRIVVPASTAAELAAHKSALARAFLARFVPIAAVAVLAGVLLLIVIAQTERLARTRSRFAATAAHELRTPLAGLRLYGELLADDLGDPTQTRQYAQRVADEAARLGRVVTNMLGFSQLERGALRVQPVRADLSRWLTGELERLAPPLGALGASLVPSVPAGIEATFDADAVGQILQNLLDNAEKYARDAADRSIAVTLRRTTGQVELSVEDRGPGVSRAVRRVLFAPFARTESTDAPTGIGLGLALSRALARAQGGELRCDGAERGARFTLTLPS